MERDSHESSFAQVKIRGRQSTSQIPGFISSKGAIQNNRRRFLKKQATHEGRMEGRREGRREGGRREGEEGGRRRERGRREGGRREGGRGGREEGAGRRKRAGREEGEEGESREGGGRGGREQGGGREETEMSWHNWTQPQVNNSSPLPAPSSEPLTLASSSGWLSLSLVAQPTGFALGRRAMWITHRT